MSGLENELLQLSKILAPPALDLNYFTGYFSAFDTKRELAREGEIQ